MRRMRAPLVHEQCSCCFGLVGVKEGWNGGRAFLPAASEQVLPARLAVSFDLPVAHKLNRPGNEHIAKARERRLQETEGTPGEEIGRSQEAPIGSTR
jgi:hypothetical protein